jgi:hypothetical protein
LNERADGEREKVSSVIDRWMNRAPAAWATQPLRWTTVYRGTITEARRRAQILEEAGIATNLAVPEDLQLASSDMLLQVPSRLENEARRLLEGRATR